MEKYFDVEVAFDGHNDEIFADIDIVNKIDVNKFTKKRIKQILIKNENDPTMERIIKKVVNYLNDDHDAGIDVYDSSELTLAAMYHYVPKQPIFEVEEYEPNKFRVINNADSETEKEMKAIRDARKTKHEYEILNYGITTHALPPYKRKEIWGPFFRNIWIAPNLMIRQELNIISFTEDEGELTLQNLVKKIVVDLNTYNNAGIESYNLNKPSTTPFYYIYEDDYTSSCSNYGAFTIVDESIN